MKKLQLNKEIIACLNEKAMSDVKGGLKWSINGVCLDTETQCTFCDEPIVNPTNQIPCQTAARGLECITQSYINCFEQ